MMMIMMIAFPDQKAQEQRAMRNEAKEWVVVVVGCGVVGLLVGCVVATWFSVVQRMCADVGTTISVKGTYSVLIVHTFISTP